jgi:hypothetical protein
VELSDQTSTDTTITESKKKKLQEVLEQNPKNQLCILTSLALHSEEENIECMTTTTTYIA